MVSWEAVRVNACALLPHLPVTLQDVTEERIAELVLELPTRWEKLGDLALLPRTTMTSPEWGCLAQPLWEAVATALGVKRLAMQAPVADAGDMVLMHCCRMYFCSQLQLVKKRVSCPRLMKWYILL